MYASLNRIFILFNWPQALHCIKGKFLVFDMESNNKPLITKRARALCSVQKIEGSLHK